MKKYIIILTSTIFLLQFNIGLAEGTCPVQSGPSEGLVTYFQDINSILDAIQNEIAKSKGCGENGTGALDNITGNTNKGYTTIIGNANKVVDYNGFLSSWEFNLFPIFTGNMPKEFYRDHDYLSRRTETIDRVIINASKKCALDTQLNISNSIKTKIKKYEIDSSTISSALSGFRKLNSEASVFFRCTVSGSMGGCNLSSKILKEEISSSYGNDIKIACNKSDSSFDKLTEQIKKITDTPSGFNALQKGIDEWKKAIALLGQTLGGNNSIEYYKQEKILLAKELQRQGIQGTQAAAILNNLNCMNNENRTLSECVNKAIKNMIQPFTDIYDEITKKMVPNSTETESIPRQSGSLKNWNYITKDIKNDYENIKTLMSSENKSQEKGLATLIQLHQNLNKTNQMLEEHTIVAQQLCNMQGAGDGVCR